MLAPILIQVYDRLDSLKAALQALKANPLASKSDLYIVSDYAYKVDDLYIIKKIRAYINEITGFRSVEGIFWEENKGSHNSYRDACEYVLKNHEALIYIEDDILVANTFLEYMNNALEFYKDDKRIISIASYKFLDFEIPKSYKDDVFLLEMYSPWGVGIWKDRYFSIDWSMQGLQEFLSSKEAIKAYNEISPHMLPILQDMIEKDKKYADSMICFDMFKTGRFTLYPTKTLSVNRGFDGRGEHCSSDSKLQNQALVHDFLPNLKKDIRLDASIKKLCYRAFYSYKYHFFIPILKKFHLYRITKKLYKMIKTT